ncbi:MAG: cytochrome c [Anaerolineae bacterium]|nr:cytochrome c [Anaerolineae bacterium]
MNMNRKRFGAIALIALGALALAACGQGATPTARPTVSPIPIYEYPTPTEAPALATLAAATATAAAAASTPTSALDPTAVARGQTNWERLECASCHGENGEGGAGSIGDIVAPPLVGLTLTQQEFVTWLRTGGPLGNAHLFSTDRLSDTGSRNLYQFVLSLGEE